ncbi:formylmethanofuran dehydrogenase subunit E family protein [Desulfococcaceae bacterium HSG8]|nr:formylmethanofuran dehydrogenase subunit E family protein [Desulfococcaceae bacterium HSG8]
MTSSETSGELLVCGRPVEGFLEEIEAFHGWKAPGLVLGGFMLDWAMELIGPDVEADAIVETCHCLPDAVQIFTPCTIGNGWLKVFDWDKFALSLYDRRKLTGHRVWFDLSKARSVPNLHNWYMRLVPKKELSLEVLLESILDARRSVLSSRTIKVTRFYERKKKGVIEICSGCGEAYPAVQGLQCLTCQGEGYYDASE